MELKDMATVFQMLIDVMDKSEKSERIAGFYKRLFNEEVIRRGRAVRDYMATAERVESCGSAWFFDTYQLQHVKDLQSISLCGNKFCANCQKLLALSRLKNYGPILEGLSENYTLCHVVWTVPNCDAKSLPEVIDKLFKNFYHVHRYFNGNAKIKGVDFLQYGYVGSLRAFEVTYNTEKRKKGEEYHPHLHSIFVLKKDLFLEKREVNDNRYSLSNGIKVREFSDLEIDLQKIWFLRHTLKKGERINLKKIKEIKVGYSCTIDIIENNEWHEVFKYATKVFDEDSREIEYQQFKTLYFATFGRRMFQGYGEFLKNDIADEIDETYAAMYDDFMQKLRAVEKPVKRLQSLDEVHKDICADNPMWTYITRKSIHQLPIDTMREYLGQSDSQERLAAALERMKLRKAQTRQEKLDRMASEIYWHYGGHGSKITRKGRVYRSPKPRQTEMKIERSKS